MIRIVYDGLPGAGKSTNIEQLCAVLRITAPPPCAIPGAPFGDENARIQWLEFRLPRLGDYSLDCQVVAIPSSERYLRLRPHLYRTADLVVLVADSTVTDPGKLHRHLIALRLTGHDRSLLLQANKQDLPGALPPAELAGRLRLPAPLRTIPAEAHRGIGVKETIHHASRHCSEKLQELVTAGRLDTIAGPIDGTRQLRDIVALYSPRLLAADQGRALSAHLRELAAAASSGVATISHGPTSARVAFSEGMIVHAEYPIGDTSVEDAVAEQLGLDPAVAASLKADARARGEPFATTVAARRLAAGPRLLQALQTATRARLNALVSEMNPRFRHEFTAGPQRAARGLLMPLDALLVAPEPAPQRSKERDMSTESIMKRAMKDIPKCVAAGVVDLDSGMLLNVKTVDSHPQEVLDLVAAATRDLYEGDNVTAIESMFKRTRGVKSDERYFQQFIVISRNLIHFFGRLASNQRIVVVAVTRLDANLGLILAQGRAICASETI